MATLGRPRGHRRHRAAAGRHAGRPGQARAQGRGHPGPEDPRRPGRRGRVHRRARRSRTRHERSDGSHLPAGSPPAPRIVGPRPLPARPGRHQRRPRPDHGHQRRVDPQPGRHRRAADRRRRTRPSPTWAPTAGAKALADAGPDARRHRHGHRRHLHAGDADPERGAPRSPAALGIHAPGAFDLNAACAGFCYGLAAADQAIRAGDRRNVLVVGSEKLTDWIDWTDRATAIIFADGAGAAVVTGADEPGDRPGGLGLRRGPDRDHQDRGPQRVHLPGGPGGLPLGDHRDRPGRAPGRRGGRRRRWPTSTCCLPTRPTCASSTPSPRR